MAEQLAKLTGFDPLSIDQTQFLESDVDASDEYHALIQQFPTQSAEVLVNRVTGRPWSALPKVYDLNVILPIALDVKTFGDGVKRRFSGYANDSTRLDMSALIALNDLQRPKWLLLDGQRYPFPIDTNFCRAQVPCVISARFIGESGDATAADCYAFIEPYTSSKLYLRQGRYRLRAWNAAGKTLSEQVIQINSPRSTGM
jgi:hypothetical protein